MTHAARFELVVGRSRGLQVAVIALVVLFAAAPRASASGNSCICTGMCLLTSARGWSGPASCTDNGPDEGAGVDDGIIVARGAVLLWNRAVTSTYRSLWVQPGGTAIVTASPVVMQFDTSFVGGGGLDTFFQVGMDRDSEGRFISNGKDLTINWIGAGTSEMQLGTQPAGGNDDPNNRYTAVTMRGVLRADTHVTAYSRGATAPTPDTDMVDCVDGDVPPVGGALEDTIVFTTGRSTDYWYDVEGFPDQCTGPGTPFANCTAPHATAECGAADCNGGACDYQIKRNSTAATPGAVASSNSWDSMTKVPGLGGPSRHPTPDDDDADGIANGDGLLPGVGDTFVVFKPVLIQGGENPITNGVILHWMTGGIDWRYVEFNKGGGHLDEDCDVQGSGILWDAGTKVLSHEGAIEFVNVHNMGSFAFESNFTDRPTDFRPNQPRVYRHWYVHDEDAQVAATCGSGGAPDEGAGVIVTVDNSFDQIDGLTFDGFHIARLSNGPAFSVSNQQSPNPFQFQHMTVTNLIVHDSPKPATYGQSSVAVQSLGGKGTTFDGVSIWDVGTDNHGWSGVLACVREIMGIGNPISDPRFTNVFAVNIDTNDAGDPEHQAGAFRVVPGVSEAGEPSYNFVVSNSYVSNIVGNGGFGGAYHDNFFKDTNLENAGGSCGSARRGVLLNPAEAIGNVVLRSGSPSYACMSAFAHYESASAKVPSSMTDRTWRIVSNVGINLGNNSAGDANGIHLRTSGYSETRDLEAFNNLFDLNNNNGGGAESGGIVVVPGALATMLGTAFYNVVMNVTGWNGAIYVQPAGIKQEGKNRFFNVTQAPAVAGGNGDGDVDFDLQYDSAVPLRLSEVQSCNNPYNALGPSGDPVGPLRFGIQSFAHFHPAVMPLLDPDAFKRYDWTECAMSAWKDFNRR